MIDLPSILFAIACQCEQFPLIFFYHTNCQETCDVSHREKDAKIVSRTLNILAASLLRKLGKAHDAINEKKGHHSSSSSAYLPYHCNN